MLYFFCLFYFCILHRVYTSLLRIFLFACLFVFLLFTFIYAFACLPYFLQWFYALLNCLFKTTYPHLHFFFYAGCCRCRFLELSYFLYSNFRFCCFCTRFIGSFLLPDSSFSLLYIFFMLLGWLMIRWFKNKTLIKYERWTHFLDFLGNFRGKLKFFVFSREIFRKIQKIIDISENFPGEMGKSKWC